MLDLYTFGKQLIKTLDLDPLYVGLVGADLPRDQLHRWLMCYFCFYHVGVASWMSEETGNYWSWMRVAAYNKVPPPLLDDKKLLRFTRWPRGVERRHFRGLKAVTAIESLKERPAEVWLSNLIPENKDVIECMQRVQQLPMFGKWISFKVVDMLERVAGVPLSIPGNVVLLYEEPRLGLARFMFQQDMADPKRNDSPAEAFAGLVKRFSKFKAPPRGDRASGPAEVETILCKWKSYLGGHYWVGKDIHEQRAGLVGWGETANKLLEHYPSEVERDNKYTRDKRQREVNTRPTLFD